MNKSDKTRFMRAMTVLCVATQTDQDKPTIGIYFDLLKDLSIEAVEKAMQRASLEIKTTYGKLPTIAQIRELAGDDPSQRATQAWTHVLAAISTYGTCRTVDFDDGLINYSVVEAGGWQEIGKCDEQALDWRRREFLKAYSHAMKHPPPVGAQKALVGYADSKPKFIITGMVDDPRPHSIEAPSEILKLVEGIG